MTAFWAEDEVVRSSGSRADETAKNFSKSEKLKNDKSENLIRINIKAMKKPRFPTPGARKAFKQLN